MAEALTLSDARKQLDKVEEERDNLRQNARNREKELKKQADDAAKVAKDKEKELRSQLKGPNTTQMIADLGGLVVGEGLYRLLQLGLTKLGAKNVLWYTVPTGVVGTALYAIFYPKKDEGLVRQAFRTLGMVWQVVSLHDGIGYVINSGHDKAQATAQLQQQLANSQQQLAALQQQAAQQFQAQKR